MATLLLVRHAEAQYRAGDGSYLPDGDLTARGVAQARAAATSLRGLSFQIALTSPCRRALQTAALLGLSAMSDPDLAEWRYRPYAVALAAGRPEADDPWWIWKQAIGPQSDAPETLAELTRRVDRVLTRLRHLLAGDATAILVSHGHLLRVLTVRWLGLPARAAACLQLAPASISRLVESGGHPVLAGWNSASEPAQAA
jgi:broad specificity phosphatase PhoE